MADYTFFESEVKESEKKDFVTLLMITVLIVAGVMSAFVAIRKTLELSTLEKDVSTMKKFIESSDTQNQIARYHELQASITEITNLNLPVMKAYTGYRILNTATGSLIDDYVWGPIKENPDQMEFKALSLSGNNLKINVCVNDTGVMREYQSALIDMTVNVDKDNIDKLPGAETDEGDAEINKFKDQFSVQITRQNDANFNPPYEGTLSILINKDITEDMYYLLGKGQ